MRGTCCRQKEPPAEKIALRSGLTHSCPETPKQPDNLSDIFQAKGQSEKYSKAKCLSGQYLQLFFK